MAVAVLSFMYWTSSWNIKPRQRCWKILLMDIRLKIWIIEVHGSLTCLNWSLDTFTARCFVFELLGYLWYAVCWRKYMLYLLALLFAFIEIYFPDLPFLSKSTLYSPTDIWKENVFFNCIIVLPASGLYWMHFIVFPMSLHGKICE